MRVIPGVRSHLGRNGMSFRRKSAVSFAVSHVVSQGGAHYARHDLAAVGSEAYGTWSSYPVILFNGRILEHHKAGCTV